MRSLVLIAFALFLAVPVTEIRPVTETESAAVEVDDPALWINPADPASSLIVGTLKQAAPDGAIAVYNLDGKILETINDVDRPDNVDIQDDICIVTERLKKQLRIYRVTAQKPHLHLLATVPVFAGETGERAAPMGIGLY